MKASSLARLVATVAVLAPLACAAASFDCAKARTPVEKAVCKDAALSRMDEQLAAAYAVAMKPLTSEGQRHLREGQRQWLGFRALACTAQPQRDEPAGCLRRAYTERLAQLKEGVRRVGPFQFGRLDEFRVARQAGEDETAMLQLSVPWLDAPQGPAALAWNAAMSQELKQEKAGGCYGAGEQHLGFRVEGASARLISVRLDTWQYCDGAVHGQGSARGLNLLLGPALRRMAAEDLFGAGKGWQRVLLDQSLKALREKSADAVFDTAQVREVVTDPAHWTLRPAGLLITINPYEVQAYVFGSTEVLVPWPALKAHLVADAPLPDVAGR